MHGEFFKIRVVNQFSRIVFHSIYDQYYLLMLLKRFNNRIVLHLDHVFSPTPCNISPVTAAQGPSCSSKPCNKQPYYAIKFVQTQSCFLSRPFVILRPLYYNWYPFLFLKLACGTDPNETKQPTKTKGEIAHNSG